MLSKAQKRMVLAAVLVIVLSLLICNDRPLGPSVDKAVKDTVDHLVNHGDEYVQKARIEVENIENRDAVGFGRLLDALNTGN